VALASKGFGLRVHGSGAPSGNYVGVQHLRALRPVPDGGALRTCGQE